MMRRNTTSYWRGAALVACWTSCHLSTANAVSATRQKAIVLVKQAEAAFYAGAYNRTLALCREASRLDPNYVRAYTWMGATYEKRGAGRSARRAYRRVLALAPRSADARHARVGLSRLGTSQQPPLVATSDASSRQSASGWRVVVNGSLLESDTAPLVRSGRVLVPMRALFEALQATVEFDGQVNLISARRESRHLELQPGVAQASVNGQPVSLDAPPLTVEGRTMIPLRLVAEALGARVGWDGRQAIDISLPSDPTLIAGVPRTLPQPATASPSEQPETAPGATSGATSAPTPKVFDPAPKVLDPVTPPSDKAPSVTPAPRVPPPTVLEVPPQHREASAAELLIEGGLRVAPEATRVQGRPFEPMFELAEQDADMVFQLDKKWQWFEAQVAVADNSASPVAELAGWLDDTPTRPAFKDLQVRAGRAPVTLRIPVSGATRLTLAPLFPGYPVLIINPRFIR